MKGLCYIKQFHSNEWAMGFRFIFRYDDTNKNDIHDEWITLSDAVVMAYEAQKNEAESLYVSDFCDVTYEKTFSLSECGVVPPSNVKFDLRMIDTLNALLGGRKNLSVDELLSLSIAELFVRHPFEISKIIYATSNNYNDLENFANNLGNCPKSIATFVSDQFKRRGLSCCPYFTNDPPQIFKCVKGQNIPSDFYTLLCY